MAISASAVWEVRTTGNDANGGFYVSGAGVDYSQQDAAQLSVTDGVTNGTTTVTSATGGFTANMVNNGINIAGTARQITAYTNTNTITVDATVSAATGQTMKVGGATATPGYTASKVVAGNKVWLKGTTFMFTSSTPNIAGGPPKPAAGSTGNNRMFWRGYSTVRGDSGTVTFQAATTGVVLFNQSVGTGTELMQIVLDGNSQATSVALRGENNPTSIRLVRCQMTRCVTVSNSSGTLTAQLIDCKIFSNTGGMSGVFHAFGCEIYSNTGWSIGGNGGLAVSHCLIYNNTGSGVTLVGNSRVEFSTFYGNSGSGITFDANSTTAVDAIIQNNILVNNGAWGITAASGSNLDYPLVRNNATYNNTSGSINSGITRVEGNVALTGDPFTNAASGDFSLNATAGAGAACRAAGIPGVFPGGLTTGYLDIGAAQHASVAGGGFPLVGDGGLVY